MNKIKYTGKSKILNGISGKINWVLDHLISDVTVNGESVVSDNVASITVPINTSDLNNDSGFITNTVNNLTNYYLNTQTYTKDEVNGLIAGITTVHFELVQVLPESGEENIIYLVPAQTTEPDNIYEEWIWISNRWECIGSTAVDLSNYYTKTESDNRYSRNSFSTVKVGSTDIQADSKSDTFEIEAGDNVTLTPDSTNDKLTISATDTKYSTMASNEVYTGTVTTAKLARADRLKTDINKLIDDKINLLDDTGGTAQASETIASWSETDGKVTISTQAIAIQKSQVTDFSHTHGNIQNNGTLQTTDVVIADGDKLVITDASNSNKITRASRAFDGTTTTKALTPKGTFETFSKLVLGETSDDAYRGDRGKTAYEHSQLTSGNPHSVTKSDVGLGNVPNVTTNNQKPTFTQASTRANLVSNTDTLSTIMGKIMKWFDDLKTVAFTGSYNDLSNTPTIPTVNNAKLTIQKNGANVKTFTANASSDVTANIVVPTALADLTEDSTHKFVSQAEKTTWNGKSDFSGSYNDLTDKPTIPTVNNATLTIQKNGTNVQTFTANASSNKTANITVPVALSELTDDATHRVVTDTQISSWDSKGTSNLTLGTSSTTAYRGDRGNTAYTHATDSSRLTTATASGLYKVGSTAQGHISELVAVEKADITALGIPASDTNTHRPIQLNGTQILGNNTTVLNLKNGSNVSMTNSSGTVTINSTDENVKQSPKTDDVYYRVLLSNSNSNSEETGPANKSAEVTVNPSTGRLRSKRFSVENNEAYSVYPINVNVTGREASTAGQDIKVLQVQYKTTNGTNTYNHTTYPISVIGNDASNTNNSGVRLGSVNGTTIVGAGECSDDFASAQSHYNDEKLYLVADDRVEMYVGLPNAATSYSAYMILGSGVGEGALEAGVLQFGTPDHFVRLKPPSNAAFSDVEFPTGGGLLITDNLVKWYSQGNYSGTGGKKLQPKTIEELQFVVHLPSSIDVTINITGIGITSSANATSNPGTYQSLRQGYYYATTAFGCVNIWVWVNTSNNYIYCQLKEVYQNNTTNIASSTSYDVYYR